MRAKRGVSGRSPCSSRPYRAVSLGQLRALAEKGNQVPVPTVLTDSRSASQHLTNLSLIGYHQATGHRHGLEERPKSLSSKEKPAAIMINHSGKPIRQIASAQQDGEIHLGSR